MAKTKLNIKLLKRLRDKFLRMRHRKHFRMKQVAVQTDCGAAMCMIGHVLVLEGYKMRKKRNYSPEDEYWGEDDPARSDYNFISPKTGKAVGEPLEEAALRLGMSSDDASEKLFYRYELTTPKQAAGVIQKIIDSVEHPA